MTRQDAAIDDFALLCVSRTLSKMSASWLRCSRSPHPSPPSPPRGQTRRLTRKRHSAMPSRDQWQVLWSRIEDELRDRPPEPPSRQLSEPQTELRRHILRLAINANSSAMSEHMRDESMHGSFNLCDFYRHVPSGSPARVLSHSNSNDQIKMQSLVLWPDGRAVPQCHAMPNDQLVKVDSWSPTDLERIAQAPEPGVFVDPLGVMSVAWSQVPAARPPCTLPELL